MNNTRNYLIYLSGPITGETYEGCSDWRIEASKKIAQLSNGEVKTLSPLRGKQGLESKQTVLKQFYTENPLTTPHNIMGRDYNDTVRSDLVLVNLKGSQRVSIGTVMEVAWAYQSRVPVIIIDDKDGIHNHIMLYEYALNVVDNFDLGVELALTTLLPDQSEYYLS